MRRHVHVQSVYPLMRLNTRSAGSRDSMRGYRGVAPQPARGVYHGSPSWRREQDVGVGGEGIRDAGKQKDGNDGMREGCQRQARPGPEGKRDGRPGYQDGREAGGM